MSRTYVVGVDGGGTRLRVAVVTDSLDVLGSSLAPSANPSLIGREAADERVRAAIEEALADAGVPVEAVAAVALGVAGAAASHSRDWLQQVGRRALPKARVVPSADYEIALAGANGRLEGVLIAAGTGSVAFGASPTGETALAGGWGYLLGDEGSGYWLGLEGLRAVAAEEDGSGPQTALSGTLLQALGLDPGRSGLIRWLYAAAAGGRAGPPRTSEVAALAPLVLDAAAQGDEAARDIVGHAADHLADLGYTVARRLDLRSPRYAFTGGLLSEANPLSLALCRELGLDGIPTAQHPPVIGAALLALRALETSEGGSSHAD